jgi:hypothetical protein
MHKDTKPILVYIVGRGHSGSTLLELLLNRSAKVASMGELDLFTLQIYRNRNTSWLGTCSCNKRPYDCEVWGEIIREINKKYNIDLTKDPLSWRLSDVGANEEFERPGLKESLRHYYHRWIRTFFYRKRKKVPFPLDLAYRNWVSKRDYIAQLYAKIRDVEVVVDTSKDQLDMRDIDNYSNVRHKFIYLTRDVRGNVWSAIRRESVTAKKEAMQWTRLNKKIIKMLSFVNKEKYLHVRYEDLCASPEATLKNIHDFLGVEYAPLGYKEEFKRRHTIAGNRVRFKEVESIKHDLVWQENLSEADLKVVKSIAGKTAESLGYEL